MHRFHSFFATLLLGALLAVPAAAEEDLLTSIYTDSGIELTRDERLFTLFAALNAAGFDRAEQVRSLPFPRAVFHPLREKVRARLAAGGEKLRAPVDQFVDAHPVELDAWLSAALALGDAPGFAPKSKLPASLAGLDRMLAGFHKAAKLDAVGRQLAGEWREELKRLSDAVDAPFSRLRAAYRLDEEEAAVLTLVPNPLDAADATFAWSGDELHVVVFGLPAPGRPLDLSPALRAYSRLLAREAVGRLPAAKLKEAEVALKAAGLLTGTDARAVLAGSLSAAVEARHFANAASIDEALHSGFVLARAFHEALGGELEGPGVLQPILVRVDLTRAVAEARARR